MPWVRLDDRFPSHRKVALLSDRAFRLYVAALCWSSENLTEGRILARELPVVVRLRGAKAAAAELEAAGLWDPTETGWAIHDYLEYNPDRARVQSDREANAARQQAWRDRKKAERDAKRNARDNGSRNGVTTDSGDTGNDASATRTRHDDDTTERETDLANWPSSQVEAFRNGVSNAVPSPPPAPTTTSFGSSSAASSLPDALADLKTAVAAAGLRGVAWTLKPSQWEYTRQALDRVGVAEMVAFAANSARLRGLPATAAAWVDGWRSLEPTPQQNGVAYLPAAVGWTGPAPVSRLDQKIADGMALARRLEEQERTR